MEAVKGTMRGRSDRVPFCVPIETVRPDRYLRIVTMMCIVIWETRPRNHPSPSESRRLSRTSTASPSGSLRLLNPNWRARPSIAVLSGNTSPTTSPASMDLFVVPTAAFRLLYGFIILRHDRRRIVHFGVTEHPTAIWIAQQITEAFPWDTASRYMIRDRGRSARGCKATGRAGAG